MPRCLVASTHYVLLLLLVVFEKRIITLVGLKCGIRGCCQEAGPEKWALNLRVKDFKYQVKLSRLEA